MAALTPEGRVPWALLTGLVVLWALSVAFQLGPIWAGNEDYQYGWFVPLLCALLFWERWKVRPPIAPGRPTVLGWLGLVAGAVALALSGLLLQVSPNWRFVGWIHAGALVGLTLGILVRWGGWAFARHFAFPVIFFLVAVPWHSRIERPLIDQLSLLNAASSAGLASVLGTPCLRQGLVIETGGGPVGVADACSGIRSVQSTIMIALFLGELFCYGILRRLFLLGAGLILAVAANVARTTYLVRTCDLYGAEGVHLRHDSAGFTILAVTLAGLLLLVWWLTPSARLAARPEAASAKDPAPASSSEGSWGAVWVLLGLCASMATFQAGVEVWFREREMQRASMKSWTFQPPVPPGQLEEKPIAAATRAMLKYDEGRFMEWKDPVGHRHQVYFLRWNPARDRYRAAESSGQARGHAPSLCLSYAGMTLQTNLGTTVLEQGNVRIQNTVERYLDHGRSLHVLAAYWEPDWSAMTSGSNAPHSTSRAFREAKAALQRRSRGREEKRVIKIGVWDMDSDASAQAALLGALRAMISETR